MAGTEYLDFGVKREVGLEQKYESRPYRQDIITVGTEAGPPKKGCVEKRMKAKNRALGNGTGRGASEARPAQPTVLLLHPVPLFLVQVIVIVITCSLVTLSLVPPHPLSPGQQPNTLPSALSP